jgi:diaminopimelate epimerase
MTQLAFTKMQGAGNDFVVLDATRTPFALSAAQLRRLADRHFGVGCDQVLVVERSTRPDADFRYRIFNADGAEVEHCGNGARCFVRYVRDRGLTTKRELRVEIMSGIIVPRLEDDGEVSVDMGAPILDPVRVPFTTDRPGLVQPLALDGKQLELTVVSMGNPHAVQLVADVDAAPVQTEGPRLEHHPRFPKRVNAGYMQVVDRRCIRLRVWERGAGETLACGTGACAAVVEARGGALTVSWAGGENPVWMKGPAMTVFEGTMELAEP